MEGLQVRLVGDPHLNVQLLLRILPQEQGQRPLLASVFTILYTKIERLRLERNHYRQQVANVRAEHERERQAVKTAREGFEEERRIWEQERCLLAAEIGKWQEESEKLERELAERSYLPQNDLSPLPLSNYRSCQLPQDKENLPSDRGHSISVFGQGEQLQGNLVGDLMRKYNLSAGEFKEILVRHIEEEGRLLEKLQTESQRRLFQQSKKIKNYDEWMRKVKKQCNRSHSPLRPLPLPNL